MGMDFPISNDRTTTHEFNKRAQALLREAFFQQATCDQLLSVESDLRTRLSFLFTLCDRIEAPALRHQIRCSLLEMEDVADVLSETAERTGGAPPPARSKVGERRGMHRR